MELYKCVFVMLPVASARVLVEDAWIYLLNYNLQKNVVSVCSYLKLHRVSYPLQKMDHLPGVSVIKPLMGVDPFLETNLESHFTLDYPKVR